MSASEPTYEGDVVTNTTSRSVADTVERLSELLDENGLKRFAVVDQRPEARAVGLDLRETTLVIFGSPAAGTANLAGIDTLTDALVAR